MAKKSQKTNISYRILKIHTIKFSFNEIDSDKFNSIFENGNSLSVTTNVSFNIDESKSKITIDINTHLINNESIGDLVEHTGRTIFDVKGLTTVYNEEDNSFDLPDEFVVQLFGLAYSHSRALLAVEISPTIYKDKYFLPVIDPISFLKKHKNKGK